MMYTFKNLRIFSKPFGPFATNCYIIISEISGRCFIVDPGLDSADTIVSLVSSEKLILEKILLTHSHWDHIGNVASLAAIFNIPVFVHTEDAANLIHPGTDRLPMFMNIQGYATPKLLHENDEFILDNARFTVLHTPGHSPGSVCFYEPSLHILISGDTLFEGSYGNVSFPTSSPKDMKNSLKYLCTLPPNTQVFPGHGESTYIENELYWLENIK